MKATESVITSNFALAFWYTIGSALKALPIVYQKTPFELEPEDGFIKKPNYVAD